jgi:parallel beta-helix repeat protein
MRPPGHRTATVACRRVACAALCGLACTFLTGAGAPPGAACPSGSLAIAPGQSLSDAVGRSAEGSAFCLKAGTHRSGRVAPKDNQKFYGEPGAVLNGALALGRARRDGRLWAVESAIRAQGKHGQCLATHPDCDKPKILFMADRPLRQVASRDAVTGGTFYLDISTGTFVFADDPTGLLEAAVLPVAFASAARGVTIANLVVEKFATLAQTAAVEGRYGTNWTIDNVEARLNSGVGISIGSGGRITNSSVHHNGQLGIGASGKGIVIEGNDISENNTHGFDPAWEAGGVKVTNSDHARLMDNHVHDNNGPGFWSDINCRDSLYEGNRVEGNAGAGIFHEISFAAVIRNNTVRHNGGAPYAWVWNADIQIAASEDVEVTGNDVTVNAGGIAIVLIDQGREAVAPWTEPYKTRNNYVHGNRIAFEGGGTAGGASDVAAGRPNFGIIARGNNRFERNVYRAIRGASLSFVWGEEATDWAGFQKRGQERDGTLTFD